MDVRILTAVEATVLDHVNRRVWRGLWSDVATGSPLGPILGTLAPSVVANVLFALPTSNRIAGCNAGPANLCVSDGALIYMSYPGIGHRNSLGPLGDLEEGELYFRVTPRFETAAEQYRWLNGLVSVGVFGGFRDETSHREYRRSRPNDGKNR